MLAALTALGGCTDKKGPSLGWSVEFACLSDRGLADTLTLEVRAGSCAGDAVYETSIARGDTPANAAGVGPGEYGLFARASAEGEVVAEGCVLATLPADEPPSIVLYSDACRAALADAGEPESDGAVDDARVEPDLDADVDSDAEIDAEVDAEVEADAEVDAWVPPVCPPSCDDANPCTSDRCEDGLCVNEPLTEARECDRLPCTVGDQCVLGTCEPGAPSNDACRVDDDPCTAETCVPGVGCNVAPADSGSCDDNIACTANDTCRAGICRGTDNCPGGVCSAGTGQCIAGCTLDSDCRDNLDCTNDVCNTANGQCVRNPVTGGECNDNVGCTVNDTCSAGACAGTSTCPSDATCEGTTCKCSNNRTLCGATCVDTNTSTAHCGLCDRACGSGRTCQNGACRPSSAPGCTARRFGGHDYLFCTNTASWGESRNRCRGYTGYGLLIIDSQAENDFVRANLNNEDAWIAANDNGDDASDCKLSGNANGEGHWHWASATTTSEQGTPLCTYQKAAPAGCLAPVGTYQNWGASQPDNKGCGTPCPFICLPGQDCGLIQVDGTWDDADCGGSRNYVCETP